MSKICEIHGELDSAGINSQNRCRVCVNKQAREWKKANRERVNATNARSRENNPAIWTKSYKKDYMVKKERIGSKVLNTLEISRRRGISVDDYELLFIKQDHKCAICGELETKKNRSGQIARLTLDHNHTTNKNRELLCHACNLGIGVFEESIEYIQAAIAYLKYFEGAK